MDLETKKKVEQRLRRVAGQVGGIQKMVEEDRYCVDILLQIAAARAALAKAGSVLLQSHVQTCVAHALREGNEQEQRAKLDELLNLFDKAANS